MLLAITTTHNPATDLGYLLHKNRRGCIRSSCHSRRLIFSTRMRLQSARTAALLLDVDPVGLVRGKRGQHEGGTVDQYVNDRPYVLSSLLSVAMGRALGTAMTGRSKGRLADQEIPVAATLAVVACRGGEQLLRELFEPLGYEVSAVRHPLAAAETTGARGARSAQLSIRGARRMHQLGKAAPLRSIPAAHQPQTPGDY
jgi:hypothetical protein